MLEKDDIICVSLVNATICLKSIGKLNILNLRNCSKFYPNFYTLNITITHTPIHPNPERCRLVKVNGQTS